MAQTTTSGTHAAHPLARATGIDVAIVVCTIGAILLTFGTGQGVADWHNIVFPPLVMLLAVATLLLVFAEIRSFAHDAAGAGHRGRSVLQVSVALVAMVVVAPMLLIMPFVFLGAIF